MKNLRKHISKRLVVLLAVLMIMSSLAACSKSASKAPALSYNMASNKIADTGDVALNGDWGVKSLSGDDYDSYETNAATADYEPAEARDAGADVNSDSGAVAGADTLTERKLIRTCTITAQTEKFDEVVANFKAKVNELGGYFENSNVNGTGKNNQFRTGTYVVRVPQDKLDALIESVNGAVTVTSTSENSVDRTLQYVDMESKVKSLKVEQQTLMDLLAKADSLDSIIVLQNRLSEIRYQIESYETQLKTIDNQVTYATLNLTIREVIEEEDQPEIKKRTFLDDIKDAFSEMLENVVEFGEGAVILFIMLLPLTVVLIIAGIIVLICIKRGRKKRAAKRAAAAAASAQAETPEVKEEASKENAETKEE
ncbi:MAG: DUF4349 domain-containing protein [Clostridiales bacterium]|nr:DUF4349 domain-containing protein [Clostridiales bacterium]